MSLERKDLVVNQFMWNEGGFSIPAGELLFVITTITKSQLSGNYIANKNIVAYLQSLNLIEQVAPEQYKLKIGMERACLGLGNRISSAVGSELKNLPTDTEVNCPRVHRIKSFDDKN